MYTPIIVALDGSEVAECVAASVTLVEVTRSPREFRGHVDSVASAYLAETANALRQQGPTSIDERVVHCDAA